MAPSDNRNGANVWFAVVVGLVFLITILIGALVLGPVRSSEGRGEIRIDRPILPMEPRLPSQPLQRQVA
jgi:hypothetical protein